MSSSVTFLKLNKLNFSIILINSDGSLLTLTTETSGNTFFTIEHSILLSSINTKESNPRFKVFEIFLIFVALSL